MIRHRVPYGERLSDTSEHQYASFRRLLLYLQRSDQSIVFRLGFVEFQENLVAVLHAYRSIDGFLAAFLVEHLMLFCNSCKMLIDRFQSCQRGRVSSYFFAGSREFLLCFGNVSS